MTGEKRPTSQIVSVLLKAYDLGFGLALPFLRKNKRLQNGWEQRMVRDLPEACDLWIQAASGGEAYLALEILHTLNVPGVKVMLTANTVQGLEILQKGMASLPPGTVKACARFCPFDKPAFMARFVKALKPRLIVLLETELWPGMLNAAKRENIPVLLANGRISPKSLKGYTKIKGLFRALAPNVIMAISAADAQRFGALFINSDISVMPNIKFDRIQTVANAGATSELERCLPNAPFVVLGSVRKEEEPQILAIIKALRQEHPEAVIGLYPRHMERVGFWRETLQNSGIPFSLRSELADRLPKGAVLLGDTFGELGRAYQFAAAVFVGGSLAPLGGQNFMEPLAAGVVPVIGPHWKNFAWVGEVIADAGLLRIAPDEQGVARALGDALAKSPDKDEVKARFAEYIARNLGGTKMVCDKITELLCSSLN